MVEKEKNCTQTLSIEGMTCINCALNLERSIKKTGIENVHVNFGTKELIFENKLKISASNIQKAIQSAGFSIANNKKASAFDKHIQVFSFIVAGYFLIIMFFPNNLIPPFFDFILAGLSLAIGFYKFGKGAYYSLKSGSANMYVLILLGATTAFIFSIYLMLFQSDAHLYFETTAVLIALVLIGNMLEENAINKTLASITILAKNKISYAKKVVGSDLVQTSINSLKIGDIIQGNSGDEIYTDAILTSGTCFVDESLISGESEAIRKNIGDSLVGGSIIAEGSINYEVLKTAHLSTKAKIQKLVQNASGQKADVQKLADKISGIFVPLIIILAILSFFMNYFLLLVGIEVAILRSVAILVISCPCAMGLATPIAVMVGLGKMSKEGILVKNANVFENLSKVNQVIFDKTGTLTTGNFKITNFKTIDFEDANAKQIIVAIEKKSSHPIAQSILKEWSAFSSFTLVSSKEQEGKGMQAQDEKGNNFLFGSASFTNQNPELGDLFLVQNQKLIAHLSLVDALKKNAKESIQYLKEQTIETIVLSGDKMDKCAKIEAELDVPVKGELKPEDKLQFLNQFENKTTAMLGDGINDAPTLAKVNVGVSFADASNLAMQTADVILMHADLNLFQKAHQMARMTYMTIKQNLFWAFAYNLVAIPLAALGIINPMWAAFFMIFSDLIVVGNALVLKSRKV